jgi:AcrR family transcriptional regulator
MDAVLDLIAAGVPTPTAQQIADRSGVSIRTVFRLTQDLESLLAAAVQRQAERVAPLYVALPTSGSRPSRIRALISNRASIFETIAPVRRVGEHLALRSPHVAEGIDRQHRVLRSQVQHVFEPELSLLRGAVQTDTLNAIDVVTGWETWEQLRRLKGLSVAETSRVVRHLLDSILGITDRE